jgi:HD-GYP domain-containing protein (c-di-GMP phosphodiesterase class II)
MFWPQNKAGPLYRALIAFHANKELRREAETRDREAEAFRKAGTYDSLGKGLGAFVRATHRRLAAMENGRGKYTDKHSREVATFAGVISIESILRDSPEVQGIDPAWIFAGGYGHDVGKSVLPEALLAKECGIEIGWLKLFMGVKLTIVERSTLRHEHTRFSSEIGRIYWDRSQDTEFRIIQDMMGLHHATYNGLDGAYPSYPLGKRGADLPFHCRIAKTADFVSAVLPRQYRPVYHQQWITTFDQAIGYAIMVAGTELDPFTVSCLLTGMYDIRPDEADTLVNRLRYSGEQKRLSDMESVKSYVMNNIGEDKGFISLMEKRCHRKIVDYTDRMCDCAKKFGIEIAPDFPVTAQYIQTRYVHAQKS